MDGKSYVATVSEGGDLKAIAALNDSSMAGENDLGELSIEASKGGELIKASLTGTVVSISAELGQVVREGDSLLIMEAMKMETSIAAPRSGTVQDITVTPGDDVTIGAVLVILI